MKTYLGDGVYAYYDGSSIWLTTEDGILVTNEICIEADVFNALLKFKEGVEK